MSSAVMLERTGMGTPGMGTTPMGTPTGMPTTMNWLMVPRCTIKVEKYTGGMKIVCSSSDQTTYSAVQNLCTMLAGGMCSCYTTMNGMMVCCCNLTMGICKYETTADGISITCTSGDAKCGEMIQACCDYLGSMLKAGCMCCVMMNNTPICYGGGN
jgi:hypothetical protein